MASLLRCELYRMGKARGLKWAAAIVLAMTVYLVVTPVPPESLDPVKNVLLLPLYVFSGLTMIIAILCAVFTGRTAMEDLESKAAPMAFAKGHSRSSFYFAKFAAVYGAFVFLFLVALLAVYAIGLPVVGWNREGIVYAQYPAKLAAALGMVLFQMLAYASIFTMLIFLLRKASLVTAACVIYPFAEAVLRMLERVLPKPLAFISENLPGNVLFPKLSIVVGEDMLLSPAFLQKFIPAGIIIVLTTAAGLLALRKNYEKLN